MAKAEKQERPILFSAPMVQAILEGRKTQTRRVLKSPDATCSDPRPYRKDYEVGMRLWVRETWQHVAKGMAPTEGAPVLYRANDPAGHIDGGWRPSIFMPRWASRITLEVEAVRVERLQEISEQDAIAEGCNFVQFGDAFHASVQSPIWTFHELWDSINGKKFPWESDPWVWAVTFKNAGGRS